MDSTVHILEENVGKIFKGEGLEEEVLMVQEVKREYYGRWYLPAGRMEGGESIVEALQREEEAGLDCQPVTLLLVEEQGPQRVCFTFLAEITGGSLKTMTEADRVIASSVVGPGDSSSCS